MSDIRKICVVITARPSYSRIKTALQAIQHHPKLELQLVVAGSALLSRYGTAIDFIEKDGFVVNEKVFMILEGEDKTAMAKSTGLGVMELSNVFYNLKPDIVITIADRYETIATSIAATYQNIPLAHLQGGEVTGNIDEKVRHANTKLADIHLVTNEDALQRVLKLGEEESSVFNTGCPSIDLASKVLKAPKINFNLKEKYGGVGADVDFSQPYIVVMQHPVTTEYKSAKNDITLTLEAIDDTGMQTLWFWPNVDAGADGTSKGIRTYRELHKPKAMRFIKNMEPEDFLKLLYHAKCLVGNSSVGIRECSFLGVPVVNIGTRQHRRLRGKNVIDVDYNKNHITEAVLSQVKINRLPSERIYGSGESGKKIAEILATTDLKFHKTITY